MRRGESLRRFAAEHALPVVAIADLVRYRKAVEHIVEASRGHRSTQHRRARRRRAPLLVDQLPA